jgi:hypothetical protein
MLDLNQIIGLNVLTQLYAPVNLNKLCLISVLTVDILSIKTLDNPFTAAYSIPGGKARLYERGMAVKRVAGEVIVSFAFPMIGVLHILTGNSNSSIL